MSAAAELQKTYEALNVILQDKDTFELVCHEVFTTIDADGNGSLERLEIRAFIEHACGEMGVNGSSDDKMIADVFAELDEDGSNDISQAELQRFLRKLFETHRDEVARTLTFEKDN